MDKTLKVTQLKGIFIAGETDEWKKEPSEMRNDF
jgi:hypothetical protein